MIKKILAAMMMAALLLLVACGDGADSGGGGGIPDAVGNGGVAEQPDGGNGGEPARLAPNLPDANFGGYEFTIFTVVDNDFSRDDFTAEGLTGEVINDAIFARNAAVEEKLNVRINPVIAGEPQWSGMGATTIRRAAAAGDTEHDMAVIWGFDAANLVLEGLLADLNSVPYLDLSQPWWDQRANEDLGIRDRMFFTTGDISMLVAEATAAFAFNKQLAQDYALPDLFAMVREGRWTWDRLGEFARLVSVDLNADGIMDENDRFGYLVVDDIMAEMINSIGGRIAGINAQGELELMLYNPRTVAVYDMVMDIITDSAIAFPVQRLGYSADELIQRMFEGNQALFLSHGMRTIIRLRGMETDFGILPYPKLNEQQERYYTPLIVWWSMFVCVPAVQEDIERTGIILEALAAESRYTVRPAYYDISLMGRHMRDEQSEEMLDIVFNTRVFDLGWYYAIGDYAMGLIGIYRYTRGDFTSMFERGLGRAERDIERINALFDEFVG